MTLLTIVAAGVIAFIALSTTVYTCLKPAPKAKIEIVKKEKAPKIEHKVEHTN